MSDICKKCLLKCVKNCKESALKSVLGESLLGEKVPVKKCLLGEKVPAKKCLLGEKVPAKQCLQKKCLPNRVLNYEKCLHLTTFTKCLAEYIRKNILYICLSAVLWKVLLKAGSQHWSTMQALQRLRGWMTVAWCLSMDHSWSMLMQ